MLTIMFLFNITLFALRKFVSNYIVTYVWTFYGRHLTLCKILRCTVSGFYLRKKAKVSKIFFLVAVIADNIILKIIIIFCVYLS